MPPRDGAKPARGRRGLLLAAAAMGAVAALPGLRRLLAGGPAPAFEPHPSVPGFRRLVAGRVSGAGRGRLDPLVAIPERPDPEREVVRRAVRADLAGALFGGEVPAGTVPIASFSDYSCPFCRVLTERLAAMEAGSSGSVRIAWHELPILGETSLVAARAALAADRQGAYPEMHARLMRARLVPTPAYLAEVAAELGLDADRLLADMDAPEIEAALARSAALAEILGFPGTPALVVGRTVVLGEIGRAALDALVEHEGGPARG